MRLWMEVGAGVGVVLQQHVLEGGRLGIVLGVGRNSGGGAEGVSFANWSFFALCLKLVVFACGAYARILHHMRGRFEGGRVVYHIATILIYREVW